MKSKVVIAETYADYEKLIYATVKRFMDRYGGDFQEMLCEANYAFMKAFYAWDAGRAKFSTLLVWCIWNALKTLRNNKIKDETRCPVHIDAENDDGKSLAGNLQDVTFEYNFENLTSDARDVMNLILNAPDDLFDAVIAKGGQPRNWRSTLREYLEDMGWTRRRIMQSFIELRSAVSGHYGDGETEKLSPTVWQEVFHLFAANVKKTAEAA